MTRASVTEMCTDRTSMMAVMSSSYDKLEHASGMRAACAVAMITGHSNMIYTAT